MLVVNGRMVAASHRKLPTVTGDGEHSIEQLISALNADPRRGEGHEKPLTKVPADVRLRDVIARQGFGLQDVPMTGQSVRLQDTANLSTGATAADVTDDVHPDIRAICERAARAVGLDICGLDLLLPSIAEPYTAGGIVEVNAGPGLRMHLFPESGRPRDVGRAIVEMLYPNGHQGRIPIVSITGTNGKTTTTRLVGHMLSASGLVTGMTTTEGVYVGGRRIMEGDTTGPRSARTVLADRSVEAAVLETARGGLIRGGLGYDWSDVSIITNVQLDHIGQDGIEDLDDLVHVKSLVAERVREGGTLILNADDPTVVRMLQIPRVTRIRKRLVYFTLETDASRIAALKDMAEVLYYVKDGVLMEAKGPEETKVVDIHMVPVTFGGMADFQIANVLAATAACRAVGLPLATIAESLQTFSSQKHNLGRTTMYRLNQGYVVLDYGHNPEAINSIVRFTQRCPATRLTAVISLPGDRTDSFIQEAARTAAGGFHRLIIYEDEDRRGRAEGEIPHMILDTALTVSPESHHRIVLKWPDAVETALSDMIPGELIVIFSDQLDAVGSILLKRGAASVGEPAQRLATAQ